MFGRVVLVVGLLAFSQPSFRASAASVTLHFRTFANTQIRLTDIVWTGHQFLYMENTTNHIFVSGAAGSPQRPAWKMPRQVEETRCALSPGSHGFPANVVYCHSPDNKIYRLNPDGKHVSLLAALPHMPRSDGALAFDLQGTFRYRLLVATGRSGAAKPVGGTVFTVDSRGHVRKVGSYNNPGGADEIAEAPASFGSASGQALLTVDAGKSGSLVAMNAAGHARTLARLADGPNPIVVLSPQPSVPRGAAKAGLYVADTVSHRVLFAPASDVRRVGGSVLVGSELRGFFWVVTPQGSGFTARRLTTDLAPRAYNLEAAVYVAP